MPGESTDLDRSSPLGSIRSRECVCVGRCRPDLEISLPAVILFLSRNGALGGPYKGPKTPYEPNWKIHYTRVKKGKEKRTKKKRRK